MSIEFKYTIVNVDVPARCMEVVYEAEGHQTMHVGARLPFEGEPLEDVLNMFAPIPFWLEMARPVVAPEVGLTGVVTPPPPPPEPINAIPVTEVGDAPAA